MSKNSNNSSTCFHTKASGDGRLTHHHFNELHNEFAFYNSTITEFYSLILVAKQELHGAIWDTLILKAYLWALAPVNDWKTIVKNGIVVMAIVNDNYRFTLVDIGDVGHQNGSVIFSVFNFGCAMNGGDFLYQNLKNVAVLHQELPCVYW